MKNTDSKPFDNAALSLIEREVSDRVDAILLARTVAVRPYAGMSVPEIRAAAVASVRGPDATAGKSPEAIEAVFDHVLWQAEQGQIPHRRHTPLH